MGCFWGAERVFWQAAGRLHDRGRLRRRLHAEPDLRGGLHGRTGHAEAVLVVFDPAKTSYEEILRLFWENHDPTQGMRQGNDVGTQYRSAIYWTTEEQRAAAEASRDAYAERLREAGYGEITTEIARGRPVLLRRGLPPAVSRTRTRGATAGSAAPASAARSAPPGSFRWRMDQSVDPGRDPARKLGAESEIGGKSEAGLREGPASSLEDPRT